MKCKYSCRDGRELCPKYEENTGLSRMFCLNMSGNKGCAADWDSESRPIHAKHFMGVACDAEGNCLRKEYGPIICNAYKDPSVYWPRPCANETMDGKCKIHKPGGTAEPAPPRDAKPPGRKLVYIAGPYRGDVETNVKDAQQVGDVLARAGVAFICPHSNGRPHDHLGLPDDYWLESTLETMRRCDGILLFGKWEKSSGTAGEILEAMKLKKPVFYPEQVQECIEWARN